MGSKTPYGVQEDKMLTIILASEDGLKMLTIVLASLEWRALVQFTLRKSIWPPLIIEKVTVLQSLHISAPIRVISSHVIHLLFCNTFT